ncbi:MAG: hypothetical protein AB1796_11635 [Bacillota bacterium]
MSKVKILVGIASATWSYAPGEVVELESGLAKAWIAAGIAGEIDTAPENATIEPPEKAVIPTAKRKAVK